MRQALSLIRDDAETLQQRLHRAQDGRKKPRFQMR